MLQQPKVLALPTSFAKDFKPELRLLAALLRFAHSTGQGSREEISKATGIPTGSKTGKVEPMIHYALGMGLIYANKNGSSWHLSLTPIGKIIFCEDPYLGEPVSLWMMHLMLCRPQLGSNGESGVADPWYALFAISETRLGIRFSAEDFRQFLKERYGDSTYLKGMTNLILRSYQETSCLGLTHTLKVSEQDDGTQFSRNPAPRCEELFPVYTAFLMILWDEFFPSNEQLSLEELFRCTRMLVVMNWSHEDSQDWLNWMVDHGVIQLDRQTGDTLALRTSPTLAVQREMYSELV